MSFFRSFKYALIGIIYCIKNERNMRIHTVVAIYVLVFARFFELSATHYALLALTIGAVMAAEMFNTAIERLSDCVKKEPNPLIKAAKDTAAGAVLILAAMAVFVAVFLFGDTKGFKNMFNFYISHPINLAILAVSVIIALIYIIIGPVRIAALIKKAFNKK